MCYSIIDYSVLPIMYSHGSSFFAMTPLSHSSFGPTTTFALISIWCGFFGASMAVFGIHFIYRYFAVSGSDYISTFHGLSIFRWMLLPIVYGAIWGGISYAFCSPKDVLTNYIRVNLKETYDLNVEEVMYLGPYFFNENGEFHLDWGVFAVVAGVTMITSSSLFMIFYFGWKCYSYLKKIQPTSGVSMQYRTLQRQFFTALVIQTIIPIGLMHIPLLFTYSSALFNRGLGVLSNFATITIALYPVVDPLPTVFIIKSYRDGLRQLFQSPVQFFTKEPSTVAVVGTGVPNSRRVSNRATEDNISAWETAA